MLSRMPRYALAILQLIVGLEWFISGINKVLVGTFPQSLDAALRTGHGVAPALAHHPHGWYATFLQTIVLPNSAFFGYVIMIGEVAIGILMLTSAGLLLGWPLQSGRLHLRAARWQFAFTGCATVVGVFMDINFNIWRGKALPLPLINTKAAFLPIWDGTIMLILMALILLAFSFILWRESEQSAKKATLEEREDKNPKEAIA